MIKKVFISYSHEQGEWVWDDLVPCLKAGGAEVLIDRERFEAGKSVVGQMDKIQNKADISLLVFSPEYLKSKYCIHEMKRAVAKDPDFSKGLIISVMYLTCTLPSNITKSLYIDLRDKKKADYKDQWNLLLKACKADLGTSAPEWLKARDEIVRFLGRGDSVNLVVKSSQTAKPRWRELIEHIQQDHCKALGKVDLYNGATDTRRGLVQEMLKACAYSVDVPREKGEDLVTLNEFMVVRSKPALIAMLHFDRVNKYDTGHDMESLFSALRYLITDEKKLIMLFQSSVHFNELLPKNHPISSITNLKTVELGS
jgi:hypothetical protein